MGQTALTRSQKLRDVSDAPPLTSPIGCPRSLALGDLGVVPCFNSQVIPECLP